MYVVESCTHREVLRVHINAGASKKYPISESVLIAHMKDVYKRQCLIMARKKKKDDEIRTDGWMDTFADTMTLLLTFFILLYSISAVDSEKLKKLSEALQYSLTGDSSIEEVQSIDDLKVELEKGTKYEDLAAKLNEIIEKNSLTDEIKIREEERGIVLQVDESILFDSGKAEIKDSSIHVLDTIAKIIQETDNEIVAEGNTDNVPINSACLLYTSRCV